MKSPTTRYPDITDVLARKAQGRRRLAALSFGEKLDVLDSLRARVAPIVRAREKRRQAALQDHSK
jgi:hypothetical protein